MNEEKSLSPNEPPGSQIKPAADKPQGDPPGESGAPKHAHPDDDLPSHAELERMTRSELDELAGKRGVDVSGAHNKQDVIDALRRDERKRKRDAKA